MKKKTFKAAILTRQKKKLKIVNLNYPNQLTSGQINVRILYASICGAQLGEIDGIKGPDKWLPHCMGHEGYGLVVSTYDGCKTFKKNDHVILHWKKNNLKNAQPAKYLYKSNIVNAGNVTTFQEYSVVSENRLTKIPKPKNKKIKKILPLLGCAIPTAWGILNKEISILKNHEILIIGAGGIGVTLAIIAKIMGIRNINLIDKFKKKKLLQNFNLNCASVSSLKNKVKQFDYVFETTGDVKNMSSSFDCLKKNGTVVLVGQPKLNSKLLINDPLRFFNYPNDNLKIISSDGGSFNPGRDMIKIYKLLIKNINYFSKLLTTYYPLREINNGIKILKKGNAIRVGIDLT